MNNINTAIDFSKFVESKNGKAFTTSQQVSEAFDKQHHHVMQRLDALECSEQFLTSNFSRVSFEHRGNTYQACEMTKDGFMFLVMGFTGKKAAVIKEGYINAFNSMADQLGKSSRTLVEEIIGTAGVNVLNNVIRQKALRLPAEKQRSFSCTIKSRLRGRFNVARVEQIPAQEMAAACDFIAAYVIEGEYLEKLSKGGPITLTEDEACSLYSLMSYFSYLHELNKKYRLQSVGQTIGSKPLVMMGEFISEGGWPFQVLDKRRDELYKLRVDAGLKGGYAEGLQAQLFSSLN